MAPQILLHGAERQRLHVCSSSSTRVSLLLFLLTVPHPSCWIYSFLFPVPFPSPDCAVITHFSGRKNSPSTGYHTPAEALSSATERESMKSQANRVYSPFPPCVFYLFHTIMESHLRIPLFYSLHVLSWRITAHPVFFHLLFVIPDGLNGTFV